MYKSLMEKAIEQHNSNGELHLSDDVVRQDLWGR
jgi:hypothetical protein